MRVSKLKSDVMFFLRSIEFIPVCPFQFTLDLNPEPIDYVIVLQEAIRKKKKNISIFWMFKKNVTNDENDESAY